jgi:hypothetical protein
MEVDRGSRQEPQPILAQYSLQVFALNVVGVECMAEQSGMEVLGVLPARFGFGAVFPSE